MTRSNYIAILAILPCLLAAFFPEAVVAQGKPPESPVPKVSSEDQAKTPALIPDRSTQSLMF